MSWLGTVDESNVVLTNEKRLEREYSIYLGTTVISITTQYAIATTFVWGGMNQTAASNWLGTIASATATTYMDISMDAVGGGEYKVSATIVGTWY